MAKVDNLNNMIKAAGEEDENVEMEAENFSD
jgi:hypothetical protein